MCDESREFHGAKVIMNILPQNKGEIFNKLLTAPEREAIVNVCMNVKSMMDWNFNFAEFHDILCNIPYSAIEFLWTLHVFRVLPLETYLLRLSQKHLQELSASICELCLMKSEGDRATKFLQTGIMSFCANKAFDCNDDEIKEVCSCVINHITRGILSLEMQPVLEKERLETFFSIWECGLISKIALQKFGLFSLDIFLKDQQVTVMEAYAVQESYGSKKNSFCINSVLNKIIQNLSSREMEHILFDANLEDIANWKHYLYILHIFIKFHKESFHVISKCTGELIKRSFQNLNECGIQVAILIGRQRALAADDPFLVSYKQWFLAQFEDCSQLRNTQIFSFFIQVISDLLPYDKNIGNVKLALEMPLTAPMDCQSVYSDYIALLKTRIRNVKPRVEPEDIMNKVLASFQETGKIPHFIMEASLMRKHFYLNEFLSILLCPRIMPRIPDVQEKFIQELDRIGKIPSNLMQKYRIAIESSLNEG